MFLLVVIVFFVALSYAMYDMGSRTTFPGSKSQLKERIKKQYFKKDSLVKDTAKVN
jgi:hypothetical protein